MKPARWPPPPDVDVALDDQLTGGGVEAGVELRMLAQRQRGGLQQEAGERQRHAARLAGLEVAPNQRVEIRDVGAVEVGDVRDHGRRQRHPLGDRPSQVRERLALDRPILLELRQRRLGRHARERLGDQRLGGALRGAAPAFAGAAAPA